MLRHLTHPLVSENPITVQILGLCSALAVSSTLKPAFIMSVSVVAVLVFSNVSVSLLRNVFPRSIRLILEVTLIASAVIVVDEVLKAFAPETADILTVFVGLNECCPGGIPEHWVNAYVTMGSGDNEVVVQWLGYTVDHC